MCILSIYFGLLEGMVEIRLLLSDKVSIYSWQVYKASSLTKRIQLGKQMIMTMKHPCIVQGAVLVTVTCNLVRIMADT